MKIVKVICLFWYLILAPTCLSSDEIYCDVHHEGVENGSILAPYNTIEEALSDIDEDGDIIYLREGTYIGTSNEYGIYVKSGIYDNIDFTITAYQNEHVMVKPIGGSKLRSCVRIESNGGSLTLRNLHLRMQSEWTNPSRYLIHRPANRTSDIVMKGGSLDDTDNTLAAYGVFIGTNNGTATGALTLDGVRYNIRGELYKISDLKTLIVKSCTGTNNKGVGLLYGEIGNCIIENNSYTHSNIFLATNAVTGLNSVRVVGNKTANSPVAGIVIQTFEVTHGIICNNNTLVITDSDTQRWGICFGIEYDHNGVGNDPAPKWDAVNPRTAYKVGDIVSWDGKVFRCLENHTDPGDDSTEPRYLLKNNANRYWTLWMMSNIVCKGNSVTLKNGRAHAFIVGYGANGGEYADNIVTGGNFQFVIKGDKNTISNCQGIGLRPGTVKGGSQNSIRNCVFDSRGYNTTACMTFDYQDDTDNHSAYPDGNKISHCIFVADDNTFYLYSDDSMNDVIGDHNNYSDYNIFWKPTFTDAYLLNKTKPDSIFELRAQWARQSTVFTDNDQHSIEMNPGYRTTILKDLDHDGIKEVIGLRNNGSSPFQGDFNQDWKVDNEDLKILSKNWMDLYFSQDLINLYSSWLYEGTE